MLWTEEEMGNLTLKNNRNLYPTITAIRYLTVFNETGEEEHEKKYLIVLVIVLIFAIPIFSGVAADAAIPDLKGTWKFVSIERESSTSDYAKKIFNKTDLDQYVIERQNGFLFEGYKDFTAFDLGQPALIKEGISGVITDDGKHAYINEYTDGFSIVDINGPDTMVFYLLSETNSNNISSQGVIRTEVKRVKS